MQMIPIELPDWLGSGQDLFGTIQILKGKKIEKGILEMDYNYKFSDKFSYPVVFLFNTIEMEVIVDHIAFRVGGEKDAKQRMIEEAITVPGVIRTLRRKDLINFFVEVIKKDMDFAFYLKTIPKKFDDLKFHPLREDQKIIFNDKLVMEIMTLLDAQGANRSLNIDPAGAFSPLS